MEKPKSSVEDDGEETNHRVQETVLTNEHNLVWSKDTVGKSTVYTWFKKFDEGTWSSELYNDYNVDDFDYSIEPIHNTDHYPIGCDDDLYDYSLVTLSNDCGRRRESTEKNIIGEDVVDKDGVDNRSFYETRKYTSYTKVPFYDETTNREQYVWKDPLFKPTRSCDEFQNCTHVPFYSETTNKAEFVEKLPVKEFPRRSIEQSRSCNHVPFYSETTNRADYVEKLPVKRTPYRRNGEFENRTHVPFYSETTNRTDYVEKSPVKQIAYRNSPKRLVSVPFYGETTNQVTFTAKDLPGNCPAQKYLTMKKGGACYKNGHWWFRERHSSSFSKNVARKEPEPDVVEPST
ncbi:hypothetical protein KIN20_002528 [Parelaphostrongylus tenuis]|uniref:Uncharacterized protein n=1 Tax=Parelaphostrongylus tenuis TaxID=148309 RepID=A0AAD5MEC3_PARTN|nr:hypothetical protein KIN20_002528 [Parelaphostrongylus tenuis]